MKAFVIGLIVAVAIFDVLLVIACSFLETEEDRRLSDLEQMNWIKEWRKQDD